MVVLSEDGGIGNVPYDLDDGIQGNQALQTKKTNQKTSCRPCCVKRGMLRTAVIVLSVQLALAMFKATVKCKEPSCEFNVGIKTETHFQNMSLRVRQMCFHLPICSFTLF